GGGRADVEVAVGAMPAGGEGLFLLRREIDEIDFAFAKAKGGLERLDEPRAVFVRDCQAILNHLDASVEAEILCLAVDPDDFAVEPDAEIALLLEELKEFVRRGLGRDSDPEGNQHVISSGAQR